MPIRIDDPANALPLLEEHRAISPPESIPARPFSPRRARTRAAHQSRVRKHAQSRAHKPATPARPNTPTASNVRYRSTGASPTNNEPDFPARSPTQSSHPAAQPLRLASPRLSVGR